MNQRLVWNFEFSSKKEVSLIRLIDKEPDELKWEKRFFWPANQIIGLCAIDNSLLNLMNYTQKHKEDYYYLLPDNNYNIKRRRDELQYKPMLKQTRFAFGFGSKINLENEPSDSSQNGDETLYNLQQIAHEVKEKAKGILVKKEAFIYKFPTIPHIKLELARLEVHNAFYCSACIEGKSLFLVEKLSELLLGEQISCDYVTFLKNILKL